MDAIFKKEMDIDIENKKMSKEKQYIGNNLFPNLTLAMANDIEKGITYSNRRNALKEDLICILNDTKLINNKNIVRFLLMYILRNNNIINNIGDKRTFDFVDMTRYCILNNYIDETIDFTFPFQVAYPMAIPYKNLLNLLEKRKLVCKEIEYIELFIDTLENDSNVLNETVKILDTMMKSIKSTHSDDFAVITDEFQVNEKNQIVLDIENNPHIFSLILVNNKKVVELIKTSKIKGIDVNRILIKLNRFIKQEKLYIFCTNYVLSKEWDKKGYLKLVDLIYKNRKDFINYLINAL